MRKYDSEFKQQALKKVFDGQAVASVSRELGVTESLIYKWKGAALENGSNGVTGAELKENAALKKRVKELEMENEILNGSLRESSAEEVKTVSICVGRGAQIPDHSHLSGDAGFSERLLRLAQTIDRAATGETDDGGAIGQKLF